MKRIRNAVHEILWSLDHGLRQPNDSAIVRGRNIFESTHGNILGLPKSSLNPTNIQQHLDALKTSNVGSLAQDKQSGRFLNAQLKDEMEAGRDKLINWYLQLENMYDKSLPMSDPLNVRIRMAQRTLLHADETTVPTLLGYDAVVADGNMSLKDVANTREIFKEIRKEHSGINAGSIGSTNHINILNRTAIAVSIDGWQLDDFADVVNDAMLPDGSTIYNWITE